MCRVYLKIKCYEQKSLNQIMFLFYRQILIVSYYR